MKLRHFSNAMQRLACASLLALSATTAQASVLDYRFEATFFNSDLNAPGTTSIADEAGAFTDITGILQFPDPLPIGPATFSINIEVDQFDVASTEIGNEYIFGDRDPGTGSDQTIRILRNLFFTGVTPPRDVRDARIVFVDENSTVFDDLRFPEPLDPSDYSRVFIRFESATWNGNSFEDDFETIRFDITSLVPIAPVPLPAGGLLLLTGFAGMAGLKRWKKRSA